MSGLRLGMIASVVAVAVLMVLGAGASAAWGQAEPVVTQAVQVTDDPNPTRAHASPQIAANPDNGHLAIIETDVRHEMTCDVHLSFNDGRTWVEGGSPAKEPFTDCGNDPASAVMFTITYGPDGTLYVAFTASDPALRGAEVNPRHVFLARSTDSGRSFETAMVYEAPDQSDTGETDNGRSRVAVDPNDPDRVYVSWNQDGGEDAPNKALIASSSDGGRTFDDPVNLAGERGAYEPRVGVGPDGIVHAVIPERGFDPERSVFDVVRPLNYRRSTDNGQTWSEPIEVDQGNAGFSFARKWSLEVDPNDGTLYVVWYGHPDPQASWPEADRDIYLRVSTDSGETWTDRVMVNDEQDHERVQHYDPGIDIAPNGRLDIAWYDFRNSPVPESDTEDFSPPFNNGGYQDVFYSATSDQGRTLTPNVRITDRLIDRRIGVWSNNVHAHANVGIASTNDTVYFTWQDTRNGDQQNQAEDVYFASLHRDGASPIAAAAGVPMWSVAGASGLLGMGIAMVAALWLSRRRTGSAGG